MQDIREFLEEKAAEYNNPAFVDKDPVQIPRQFSRGENIEIAAFLTATIAWGRRDIIIKNAKKWMALMENDPFDFLMNARENDFQSICFVHRTFKPVDCFFFLRSLKNIYTNHGGLGTVFQKYYLETGDIREAIHRFRQLFLYIPHVKRSEKHLADITRGASAKRLNMFLRWMVRNDNKGVDLGLWDKIPSSALYIPLDVHSGTVARRLGLLKRLQNDWKAVEELTILLRQFDPGDPVKYDFALFGSGATGE